MIFRRFLFILSIICSLTLFVSMFSAAEILFYSSRTGNHEIYTMNDDGSRIQRLTDNPLADRKARWSPDGRKIVFERAFTHENRKIFIMDADGRNEYLLTDTPADYRNPAWHPDGNHIAFSVQEAKTTDLAVMNLQTGKVKRLINNPEGGLSESPNWSPNGRQLVFEHSDEFGRNIWTMTADGKRAKRRSPPSEEILLIRYRPRWASDGVHILYPEAEYRRHPNRLELTGMRLIIQNVLSGTREIHALPKGFLVSRVSWMADSREVLFSAADRNVNTVDVIYRYPLDTRELIPLTDPRDNYYVSDWRPGNLYVSPKGKLTGLWGRIKKAK
jgi:TolB protein